jgi:hypothetical protein
MEVLVWSWGAGCWIFKRLVLSRFWHDKFLFWSVSFNVLKVHPKKVPVWSWAAGWWIFKRLVPSWFWHDKFLFWSILFNMLKVNPKKVQQGDHMHQGFRKEVLFVVCCTAETQKNGVFCFASLYFPFSQSWT